MRKKVLIVDDDQLLREMYGIIIQKLAGEIIFAISGQDGWQKFEQNQPDLVITDLKMEISDDGLELAKKIKKISPNTPVIMITGIASERAEEIKKFVDSLLPKPFVVKDLEREILGFLERR